MKTNFVYQIGLRRAKRSHLSLFLCALCGLCGSTSALSASNPPVIGRPHDFSGAIGGPFVVTTAATPTQISVEEPLMVTLRIVGRGNLKEIARPPLGKLPAFRAFAVDDLGDEYRHGSPPSRIFRYRLRPKSGEITQIPPVKFVYFNPSIQPPSRGYQTTYAAAIPLTIVPTQPTRQSDELARTIAALRRQLAADPGDAQLREALAEARSRVAYPQAEMRPHGSWWPYWLNLSRYGWLAGVAALAAAVSLVCGRRFRQPRWLAVAALFIGIASVPAIGTFVQANKRAQNKVEPILIIHKETALRRGNGEMYPPRLDTPLPSGAEVRRLYERHRWLQIETANGIVGWLPETAVID